jgi:hypothetical protein
MVINGIYFCGFKGYNKIKSAKNIAGAIHEVKA